VNKAPLSSNIKPVNRLRIIVLLILSIGWRVLIGETIWFNTPEQYVVPTIGFGLLMICLGEVTRRLFRLLGLIRQKPTNKHLLLGQELELTENQADKEALNFSIVWACLWITSLLI